jgi:hypothetical protein
MATILSRVMKVPFALLKKSGRFDMIFSVKHKKNRMSLACKQAILEPKTAKKG